MTIAVKASLLVKFPWRPQGRLESGLAYIFLFYRSVFTKLNQIDMCINILGFLIYIMISATPVLEYQW